MSTVAIDYTAASDEIFGILEAVWNDPETGAQPILETLLGAGNGYLPILRIPGDIKTVARDIKQIQATSGYVSVTDGQSAFRNGNLKRKYTAVGRLAVQIYCPKNVAKAYKGGKLLARLLQKSFRNPPSGGSVWYRDERILEVGAVQNDNQINVLITCSYETEE